MVVPIIQFRLRKGIQYNRLLGPPTYSRSTGLYSSWTFEVAGVRAFLFGLLWSGRFRLPRLENKIQETLVSTNANHVSGGHVAE
jgi:hypothetical protein